MEKKPFLKRFFYKYEPKGEVEKSGKTYYRYSKTPRFSEKKIKKVISFLVYLLLAFLVLSAIDTFMAKVNLYKK